MGYLRDIAISIVIYGFFGFVWFGWALESPKSSWKKYLAIACGISFLVGLLGVYFVFVNQNEASALMETTLSNWYYLTVIFEFLLGGIVAYILYKLNLEDYIAPWICLIVGLHFFPLAYIFQDLTMLLLALLLVITSAFTVKRMKFISYKASAITGIGAGSTLLLFALFNILRLILA